jgi:hypothetical protein
MIILHNVSGVPAPTSAEVFFYSNPAGILTSQFQNGSILQTNVGATKLSGLSDVNTPFASGQLLVKSTSSFIPGLAGGTGLVLTIVSSGEMNVMDLLYSGVIENGQAAQTLVWSGIDQSYDHLEIRGVGRGAAITTVAGINVYFNGDATATNYISRRASFGSSATNESYDDSYVGGVQCAGKDNTNGGTVAPVHLFIPDFSKAGHRKYCYNIGQSVSNFATTNLQSLFQAMQWENTAGPAINMVELRVFNATTTFTSGTELYVYGHKRIWGITSGIYGTAGIVNGRFV